MTTTRGGGEIGLRSCAEATVIEDLLEVITPVSGLVKRNLDLIRQLGATATSELEAVEKRNERDFPFERRAPRLVEVIRAADPDVFSLVECDEYEAFWRGRLEELGYGSVWHKRPRASAPDGCCLGFRERDWALDAHKTISYDDHDLSLIHI